MVTREMKQIKDFMGLTIGSILGGETMRHIGNIGSGMSAGMRGATQSFVGIGLMSRARKLIK